MKGASMAWFIAFTRYNPPRRPATQEYPLRVRARTAQMRQVRSVANKKLTEVRKEHPAWVIDNLELVWKEPLRLPKS